MKVNVAYACDEAYMEQTTVSLVSLFENNSDIDELVIYFIDMGVSSNSRHDLYELANSYSRTIHIIDFNEIAYDLCVKDTGRHIQSVYAKLFFGRINNVKRILYLDSDIVVNDSIIPLWTTDLGNCICAGVETIHSEDDNLVMGLSKDARAINDGMVLMDLEAWNNENCLEKCLNYIKSKDGAPPVLSEGTINYVLSGRILILDPRYNLMSSIVNARQDKIESFTGRKYYSQIILDEASSNPCIIHYLSGFYNRPWCKKCSHPLKHVYLKYRQMTKWADIPLQNKRLPFRTLIIGFLYNNMPVHWFNNLRKIIKGL